MHQTLFWQAALYIKHSFCFVDCTDDQILVRHDQVVLRGVANDAGNVLEDEVVVIEPPVGPIKHQRLDRLLCKRNQCCT